MEASSVRVRALTASRRRRPGCASPDAPPVDASRPDDQQPDEGLWSLNRRALTKALTIRRTEERLLELFSQGKVAGTVHTCIGQEWVGVALAEHLRPGDYLFSNHRGHGHYVAWTDDVEGLVAEVMGRATGVCGGRGGSQHLCRKGFFSNGIQGGIVPVAAGLALAQQMQANDRIAVVFIGDGTLGEGAVYESLNIASRWNLPLLIVLEDNGIAQSTEQAETLAGTMGGRAEAFDICWAESTTDEPAELLQTAGEAVRHVRTTRRPFLLHVRTSRLKPHSKGDDTRPPEHVAELAARDPVNQLLAQPDARLRDLLSRIDERLDEAVRQADAAPVTRLELDRPDHANGDTQWQPLEFPPHRMNEAIRDGLAQAMERDERIVVLGEDVCDPYGGAFKVSAGLSGRFGNRVRNTPISEAAIVGIANGLALAGWRPVVEIMFGDFITLALDQFVNHAAKFAWMYNEQVKMPLVLRTPMGGYRGYGPTHSQCLEKHVLGVPGTRVLALTHRWCPGLLYRRLLEQNDRPTIVIENKLLYSQKTDCTAPAGHRITVNGAVFPTIRIRPEGPCQITMVAYGGMVPLAESAMMLLAEQEDVGCDLLVPSQLYPLDLAPVLESLNETGRLLVIEEGQGFAGFGAELIAQTVSHGMEGTVQSARAFAEPCPVPAAKAAERQALPDVDRIVKAALNLVLR